MRRNYPNNFGEVPKRFSDPKRSKAFIIPVPYEETTTYRSGTAGGPGAILSASQNMDLCDEELRSSTYKAGIHTLNDLSVSDLGPEEMIKAVRKEVDKVINKGKFPVTIGGEHTVSIAPVAACKKKFKDLSVLHIDAHYDLWDKYNGKKYNHACVARRIIEFCPIVQCGMRSMGEDELSFLRSDPKGLDLVDMYQIRSNPADWVDRVCSLLSDQVYITIDMDGFDPGIVPAVGTPVPGGLGWYETLALLRRLTERKRVVGFDLVEIAPTGVEMSSEFLAAKLIYRLLGYIFSKK